MLPNVTNIHKSVAMLNIAPPDAILVVDATTPRALADTAACDIVKHHPGRTIVVMRTSMLPGKKTNEVQAN